MTNYSTLALNLQKNSTLQGFYQKYDITSQLFKSHTANSLKEKNNGNVAIDDTKNVYLNTAAGKLLNLPKSTVLTYTSDMSVIAHRAVYKLA